MLSTTKSEYVALSACAQEVEFLPMLLVEMTKLRNSSVIYGDNQGDIFLSKNRQVVISTKRIDNCHHFLWDMVENKDIDIQYIQSEDNPVAIMTEKIL